MAASFVFPAIAAIRKLCPLGNQCIRLRLLQRSRGTGMTLLKWALFFFVISIVAAIFGFGGISAASADIAKILFFIFVVIFVLLLVLGLVLARRV